jgi:hypothetical protein
MVKMVRGTRTMAINAVVNASFRRLTNQMVVRETGTMAIRLIIVNKLNSLVKAIKHFKPLKPKYIK